MKPTRKSYWWLEDGQEPPKARSRALDGPPARRQTAKEWFALIREANASAKDWLRG